MGTKKREKIVKKKLSDLILDYGIYPRHTVDDAHVAKMVDALAAGYKLPPLIIEAGTNRVVDGFHRHRAQRRNLGAEAQVECIERTYASECDLLLDSVTLNSGHGLSLSALDRERILDLAAGLKIERERICVAMRISIRKLEGRGTNRRSLNGTTLKRSISHMAGKELTPPQESANEKLMGMRQDFIINQVITLLESGLINQNDAAVVAALERLAKALEGFFAVAQ